MKLSGSQIDNDNDICKLDQWVDMLRFIDCKER